MDHLIAEDVLLLLMQDEDGTLLGASAIAPTLGGAVLAELSLNGRVRLEPPATKWRSEKVVAVPGPLMVDPLLQKAYEQLEAKPLAVASALWTIGPSLPDQVRERLVEKGLLKQERKSILGIIKYRTFPATDNPYEQRLREQIRQVLVEGVEPAPRLAAVISLILASGQLRYAFEWDIPFKEVEARAKEVAAGNWGAEALKTLIDAAQAAIIASITAAATTAVTAAVVSSQ